MKLFGIEDRKVRLGVSWIEGTYRGTRGRNRLDMKGQESPVSSWVGVIL